MIVLATVVVTLAAALHVAIFFMESIAWGRPSVWKRFGITSQEVAETTMPMAYNQGFYNLFLAIGAVIGLILYGVGLHAAGLALILFATACMVAASIVLLTTGRRYWRASIVQGALPLIGFILMLLA